MTDDQNLQFNSQQIRGLLSPYLDNEVTAEERRLVEQGLAASAELRQELEALRQTVAMLAALPPVAAPRPFTLTEAQVRPAAPTARKRLFGLPWWVQGWAALTATLLCVLVAGGVLWRTQLGQNSAVMPAAEIANAPQMTVPAPEKEAANAVIPTESPIQESAAAPAEGGVEELAAAREAAAGPTDEPQAEAAAGLPVTASTQEAPASQVESLAQDETLAATPTAGDVMTLAESQPVPPPAAAAQSLAAPAPEPTQLPMATVPSAAPAMKESAGAGQSSGAVEAAPPAENPPTAEVQSYAAPAQESAPIVPATEAVEDQAQALPPTATIAPPAFTPTAQANPTAVARLTLSAPTPQVDTPVPTVANPENNGFIILVSLAVVIILLLVWLNRSRLFR